MAKRTANATQKTALLAIERGVFYRRQREEELKAASLESVFDELGILVGEFVPTARRAVRMQSVDGVCMVEETGIECWIITFSIGRPRRPMFNARCQKPTLHEAAVEAVLVALAWLGINGDEDHPWRDEIAV